MGILPVSGIFSVRAWGHSQARCSGTDDLVRRKIRPLYIKTLSDQESLDKAEHASPGIGRGKGKDGCRKRIPCVRQAAFQEIEVDTPEMTGICEIFCRLFKLFYNRNLEVDSFQLLLFQTAVQLLKNGLVLLNRRYGFFPGSTAELTPLLLFENQVYRLSSHHALAFHEAHAYAAGKHQNSHQHGEIAEKKILLHEEGMLNQ